MRPPPESPARDAIAGVAPYPELPIADVGTSRFIDLRGLPIAALRTLAAIDYARDVLATEAPCATCVWIVPAELATSWASSDPLVRGLVAAHLRDAHRVPGHDVLHAPGHVWDPDETARLGAVGIQAAIAATVVGSARTVTHHEVLESFDRPRPQDLPRPVLAATHHGLMLRLGPRVHIAVTELDRYAFIDFRPASLATLDNGAAFYDVEHALGTLGRAIDTIVWIVAPWLLARWAPHQHPILARLRGLVALRPTARHTLIVSGDGGDPALIRAITDLGMSPLDDTLHIARAGTTFAIPPLTALRDAVLARAALDAGLATG